MPERDANQLAADVRAGLNTGFPKHQHYSALDELVGLVGTLQLSLAEVLAHYGHLMGEDERAQYRALAGGSDA